MKMKSFPLFAVALALVAGCGNRSAKVPAATSDEAAVVYFTK